MSHYEVLNTLQCTGFHTCRHVRYVAKSAGNFEPEEGIAYIAGSCPTPPQAWELWHISGAS